MIVSHTVMSTVAPRSARLRERAAKGSAQTMYHGISQLTQMTPSSPAQPAGVAQLRLRQATAAQTVRPTSSTIVMKRRTVASAPPCPLA
jgi:hypothetical protein